MAPFPKTAASGTLTFSPGVTSQSFNVPIIDDSAVKSNSTVNLALSNPTNATLGEIRTAPLSITDPDPWVQFSRDARGQFRQPTSLSSLIKQIAPLSLQMASPLC